jgi:hypothetical protein
MWKQGDNLAVLSPGVLLAAVCRVSVCKWAIYGDNSPAGDRQT